MQHHAEMLRRDVARPSRFVAEDEHATLSLLIEAGVPDEVQDVVFAAEKCCV
jgi:hypothetical protein